MAAVLPTHNGRKFSSFALETNLFEIPEDEEEIDTKLFEEEEEEEEGRIAPRRASSMKKKNKNKKNNKKKMKKKKSYPYGDMLEELIMYEILTRLPLKSLFRFKSVCKKWHDLIIHNPFFINNHSQKCPNRTNLTSSAFFFHKRECVVSSDVCHHLLELSIPSFINGGSFCVRGSIHGLLYGSGSQIFICNPITKHVVYVPNPEGRRDFALAYDPYNNPNFGFAIVALVSDDNYESNSVTFEVYSSKTRQWRVSNAELQVPSSRLLRDFHPVFTGGKVYWSLVRHVLWFDVEEDLAGLIQCPNHNNLVFIDPNIRCSYLELGVCNGNGGELSYSKLTKEGDIEIWLLSRNDMGRRRGGDHHQESQWVKKHSVRLPEIVQQNWKIMKKYFNPMKIWNRDAVVNSFARRRSIYPLPYVGGEVVWFFVNFKDDHIVLSFNLRTRELKMISDDLPLPLYPFIPTLRPCPT